MVTSVKPFLDSIDPFDEFGFQIRPYFYWLPEPIEDEIKRLEMNLLIYAEFIRNGKRFPSEVNEARKREYKRLAYLRGGLREVV